MKLSEMKKVLAKVYDLDCKMDKWLDCNAKAQEERNHEKAALCEREYDRLSAILTGMTMALDALGYQLTDTGDGYWKINEKED